MRYQKILPENQPKNTGKSYLPNQAMLDFITFAYSDKSFDGIVQFSKSDPRKKDFKLLGCAKCSQMVAYLQDMWMFPDYNYYISANIFARPGNSKENLLAINAIVIDIDNHSKEHTITEIGLGIEALLWRLQNDFFGLTDIPAPNRIVLTGRGLQLWWCVVPAYAKAFERNFADVEKHFEQQLEQFLSDFPIELEGFEIDKGASAKPAGFFRLPGSISPHTGRETEIICLHDTRLNLLVYRDQTLPANERAVRMKRTWSSCPSSSYTHSGTEQLTYYRLSVIERLRDIRSAPVGSEMRNNFCFLYYCFAKQLYGE